MRLILPIAMLGCALRLVEEREIQVQRRPWVLYRRRPPGVGTEASRTDEGDGRDAGATPTTVTESGDADRGDTDTGVATPSTQSPRATADTGGAGDTSGGERKTESAPVSAEGSHTCALKGGRYRYVLGEQRIWPVDTAEGGVRVGECRRKSHLRFKGGTAPLLVGGGMITASPRRRKGSSPQSARGEGTHAV